MKKSIIFIILLFVLAGLVWFNWYKNKIITGRNQLENQIKNEPSVNWQTYESTIHKLAFNYPPDWQLNILKDEPTFLTLFLHREDVGQKKVATGNTELVPTYDIFLKVEENNQGLSAREIYLSNFLESAKQEAEEKIKPVKFAGLEGIEYPEGVAPASGPATVVLLTDGKKFYQFTYQALAHQETHEKYLPEFYRLLESLKFLE